MTNRSFEAKHIKMEKMGHFHLSRNTSRVLWTGGELYLVGFQTKVTGNLW